MKGDPQARYFKVCSLLLPKYHPLSLHYTFDKIQNRETYVLSFQRGPLLFFFPTGADKIKKEVHKSNYKEVQVLAIMINCKLETLVTEGFRSLQSL